MSVSVEIEFMWAYRVFARASHLSRGSVRFCLFFMRASLFYGQNVASGGTVQTRRVSYHESGEAVEACA